MSVADWRAPSERAVVGRTAQARLPLAQRT